MPQEKTSIRTRQKTNIKEPRKYKVIIHNDDFTTMDFVVYLLQVVFFLSKENAEVLMMKVHQEGKASVGIYTYDVAISKVKKATELARTNNFPLRLTTEPME